MTYHQIIQLKNGVSCCLRNGTAADGQAALDNFILTHAETDNLLTYPEENTLTATQEGEYLQAKTESPNEVEILAIVDGKVAGTAGINAVGGCYKLQHRAEFGISIAKEFWGPWHWPGTHRRLHRLRPQGWLRPAGAGCGSR